MTDTFSMPCLSKYLFNIHGECINKRTGQHKKMRNIKDGRMQYDVHQDNKQRTTITQHEIIAYGKHLSQLHTDGIVWGYMRLPSKHS